MVYQLAEQDADILAKFSVSTEGEKGVLTLTKPLDFEEKSLYQVSQFCQEVDAWDHASDYPQHHPRS